MILSTVALVAPGSPLADTPAEAQVSNQVYATGYSAPVGGQRGSYLYLDDACDQTEPNAPIDCPEGGDLTDGIIATSRYIDVDAGPTGPYVGWINPVYWAVGSVGSANPDPIQPPASYDGNPTIAFDFQNVVDLGQITIHVDDPNGFGSVFAPRAVEVTMGGITLLQEIPDPPGAVPFAVNVDVSSLPADNSAIVKLYQSNSTGDSGFQWMFVSEVEFFEQDGPEVLFREDFEQTGGTQLPDILNWNVSGGTVDILTGGFAGDCVAVGMTANCFDLAGSSVAATTEITSEQTFLTEPGTWYAVAFDLAGSGRTTATDELIVEVLDGAAVIASQTFVRSSDALVERAAVPFQVDGQTAVTLSFTSTTGEDNEGILLDNIELVELDLTPTALSLSQDAATSPTNSTVTLTALVTAEQIGDSQNAFAPSVAGVPVEFAATGVGAPAPEIVTTDQNGEANITLVGPGSSASWDITATAGTLSSAVTHAWDSPADVVQIVAFGPDWTGIDWGLTESYLTQTVGYILDPANFGPDGVVKRQFEISSVDTVTADALIAALDGADVFFTGWVLTSDYNRVATDGRTVKAILRDFVESGGRVIATTDDSGHTMVDEFGLAQLDGSGSPTFNTITNTEHPIAAGPFGTVTTYEQWLATGSYATSLPTGAVEIGRQDTTNNPSIVVFEDGALGAGSGRSIFVADVDVFSYNGATVNETLIKNIFAWISVGLEEPAVLGAVTLTADDALPRSGIGSIAIEDIPISLLTEDTTTESAPLSAIPLSAIGIADSPLSAIPLSAIELNSLPLSAIKLSDIPLSAIGGWEALLVGTPLEGAILQNVTLQDVVDDAPSVFALIQFGAADLASTALSDTSLFQVLFPGTGTTLSAPLSAIDLSASPLSAIPLSAIRIEGLPLSAIPLSAIPLSAINPTTPPDGPSLSAVPLSAIDIADSPLSAIPLSAIPLSAIDACGTSTCLDGATDLADLALILIDEFGSLEASPLSAIPLSAIDLTGIPLSAIPLSAIAPEVSPLSAIPLSAIPLSAIGLESLYNIPLSDTYICETLTSGCAAGTTTIGELLDDYPGETVESSPLSAIPLSAIPLSAIPLSAIDLADLPLSAIALGNTPLSAIDIRNSPLSAIPLSAIPLSAIATASSPLSAIPLSAIPLSAIDGVVDCSAANCTNTALTLGELADLGAIRADATLGDIVEALDAFTLGDLGAWGDTTLQDLIDSLSLAYIYGAGDLDEVADFGSLTLADLLVLLIPIDDLPWQDVDPNGLQLIACGTNEFASCDDPDVDVVRYTAGWSITGGAGETVDVQVTLPDGFVALPGLVDLTTAVTDGETASSSVSLIEPTSIDGSVVTFSGIPAAEATFGVDVKAVPGFELGTKTASVVVTLSDGEVEQTGTDSAAVEVVDRGEGLESNEEVTDDRVYYRHLSPASDVDLFDIPIPAISGSRVTVEIGQLGETDGDLVVFKPADLPPTAFDQSSPLQSVPVADEPGTQSETIQDVPTDGQVAGASTQRSTGDEQTTVINDGSDVGFYTIQVERYNEGVTDPTLASSPLYSMLIDEDPPPIVPTCAPLVLSGGTAGIDPGSLAGYETLILVNQQRMQAAYGETEANEVLSRLAALAGRADVNGVVFPVDSRTTVNNAYGAWDLNPCDPNLANNVVKAITQIVEDAALASSELRYIVVVGNDDIIPMWREADLVSLSNESDYAPTFDQSAAGDRIGGIYGALVTGNILTDAAYADFNPIPFLSGNLFVEDVAIGRLVETPAEIINQIDVFETFNGTLDLATADYAVTGYDFLADGSQAVVDALTANLGGTAAVDIDDYGDTDLWTRQDVINILNGDPDVASINAHYDHNRSLPSAEDAAGTEIDLFTVDDVAGLTSVLEGSIIFTMGCHSGLNVSSIAVGSTDTRVPDWAQQYAVEGVTYIGNTGYGYGDTAVVAYSERLMELFAAQLDGSRPAGEAFAIAKNLYYLELGQAAVYDAKVVMEATFYGLPMYGFNGAAAAIEPADPRVGALASDPVTEQQARTVTLSDPVAAGGFGGPNTSEAGGQFYTLDGAITVHDRPIQPRSVIDLPVAPDGSTPRGAFIEALAITDIQNFTVAIARPVIDLTRTEPPKVPTDSFFPTRLQNVACSNVLGEDLCRLTMIRGQFRSNDDPNQPGLQGTQRLFTGVEATVYYADPSETDVKPPTFNRVEVAQVGTNGFGITAFVTDDSPATVTRTMCLYRLPGASNWQALELVGGSGVWTGGASAGGPAEDVEVFCQAVDHAGNVGVTTFKGLNYRPAPPPTPPPSVTLSGTQGDNGWYTSDVQVRVGDVVVATVSGDGVQTVPLPGGGSVQVAIDKTPPTVNPRVEGAIYDLGQVVTDPACADAGSGLATCGHAVDTTSPGIKTVQFAATDRAGNSATLDLTYYVVTPITISVVRDVEEINVTVTASSPVTAVPGTTTLWTWGDGTTSAGTIANGEVTGAHVYTTPGVYTVTLAVVHDPAHERTATYQFVVIYDPLGGFVTGGGWIDSPEGAYTADPTLTGKANFGFVSKYKKGKTVPEGNTEFQFKAGDLKFKSTSYDWLVIAGPRAQFQGTGTINGEGEYRFFLVGIDGQANGGTGVDKFRIRIWDDTGIVYDNQMGSSADSNDSTALSGGSIQIKDK